MSHFTGEEILIMSAHKYNNVPVYEVLSQTEAAQLRLQAIREKHHSRVSVTPSRTKNQDGGVAAGAGAAAGGASATSAASAASAAAGWTPSRVLQRQKEQEKEESSAGLLGPLDVNNDGQLSGIEFQSWMERSLQRREKMREKTNIDMERNAIPGCCGRTCCKKNYFVYSLILFHIPV